MSAPPQRLGASGKGRSVVTVEHTKGPWKVYPHYCKNDPDPGPYGDTWLIGLGQYDTIAEVRPGHDRFDSQNEANARLIAAAPALFEALTALLEAMGDIGSDGYLYEHSIHGDDVAKARAALALVSEGE